MLTGVDVSHYDERVDWMKLAQGGVHFAIAKLSQGDYYRDDKCREHLAGAAAAGMRTGVYHWFDPQISPQRQVNFLLECAQGLDHRFICLDVEQHAPWLAAYPAKPLPKKAQGKPGGRNSWMRRQAAVSVNFSARQISDCAERMSRLIKAQNDLPLVIYTRVSFIMEYARPMLEWIKDYPIWLAQYPLLPTPSSHLTWETLNQVYPRQSAPMLPQGCPNWTFWQWSGDRLKLPGMSSCADLNFFNGSNADLDVFLGTRRTELVSGASLEPLRRIA